MLIQINEHYAVDTTSIVSIRLHEAARPSHGVIGNSLVLHVQGEGRVLCELMRVHGKSAQEVFSDLVSTINKVTEPHGARLPDRGLTGDRRLVSPDDYGYDACHHSDFDPGA